MALRGDQTARQRNENTAPAISQRVNQIVGDQRMSTSRPTQTHLDAYRIAAEEFAPILDQLKVLTETDLKKLEGDLNSAGVPWTPGRLPEWRDE